MQDIRLIANRNSAASQVSFGGALAGQYASAPPFVGEADTGLDQTLEFRARLYNAAETITLHAWLVELSHAA
jgi:hypothetical protein